MYRECTASFEPKLWNKVIWQSWERTTKTIEPYWQDEKTGSASPNLAQSPGRMAQK